MRFGVLGTGVVGQTISSKLTDLGHDVKMGSRKAGGDKALAWVKLAGARASEGTFAEAADFGEMIVNATSGVGSLEALKMAGADRISNKTIIDISNPLDFSNGFPPSLTLANTDSLGEQIQTAYPQSKVVKTLNTMSAMVMVSPGSLSSPTNVFVNGNDPSAKREVCNVLNSFGWSDSDIVDLGDITASRGVEAYLLLWVQMFQSIATPGFNIRIVK